MKVLPFFMSVGLASCAPSPAAPPASSAPALPSMLLAPSAAPATASSAPTTASAVPVPAKASELGISLPRAQEADSPYEAEAPNILLRGSELWVDSEPAGNVGDVVTSRRLTRLDALFSVLEARREAWRRGHPGQPLPGVANLWCDGATPLLVFKSLFQTAAFAGYPSFRLAVQRVAAQSTGFQAFVARVPGPPHRHGSAHADSFALHLDQLADGRAQLVWKVGSRIEDTLDVTTGKLGEELAEQWQSRGGHQSVSDRSFDQLVLHASNELTLDDAVRLLDAVQLTKRDFAVGARVVRVPAFQVTFSVN